MIFDPYQSNRLTGDHAKLYRESLGGMIDIYREEWVDGRLVAHWTFGVPAFDAMTVRRQFDSLIRCSASVLEGQGCATQWTPAVKAAFYTVYMNVLQQIQIEEEISDFDGSSIELMFLDDAALDDAALDDDTVDDAYELGDEPLPGWRDMIAAAWCHESGGRSGDASSGSEWIEPRTVKECRRMLERLVDCTLPDRCFECQDSAVKLWPTDLAPLPMGSFQDPLSDDYSTSSSFPEMSALVARLFDLAGMRGLLDPAEESF